MRLRARLAAAALLALAPCAPLAAHIDRKPATERPGCTATTAPYAIWLLNETDSSDCDDTGGGTAEALCLCQDATWTAVVSGGPSFETMNAPAGTDPVADGAGDTLNLTSGAAALSITGDSSTDTVTFDVAGTAAKCARFDGSGELVAATGDCTGGAAGDGTIIVDADADTKVQVEESADEDKIRFDTGGTERVVLDSAGFSSSVPLGTGSATLASADCIARDATYGLYADADCDGALDAAEMLLNPPSALVYNSGTFTHNSTNNWLNPTFDSEDYDPVGMHSTVSNQGRITFPIAGVWSCSAFILWDSNATNSRQLALWFYNSGGSLEKQSYVTAAAAGVASGGQSHSAKYYASAANAYAMVALWQNSGGNRTVTISSQYSVFGCSLESR